MTISINEITAGTGLKVDGNLYVVIDYNHVKPGKGSAFVRVRMKNLKTEQVLERTYRSSERLEDVFLEKRACQYLYRSGSDLHFMDQKTFEEMVIPEALLGNGLRFLQDNSSADVYVHNGQAQKVELPNFIETKIIATEPGVKGDSARTGTKTARIDTGADVQVPLFIEAGDTIKLDTRTGTYVERIRK